jgi:hypothetical protein
MANLPSQFLTPLEKIFRIFFRLAFLNIHTFKGWGPASKHEQERHIGLHDEGFLWNGSAAMIASIRKV